MTDPGILLEGGCHCGANRYRLHWPQAGTRLPARRCTCTFCKRFNGTWTSHPDAALNILESSEHPLSRYRFGTATADFLFCSRCGVALVATCEVAGSLRAVVNVNTLDGVEDLEWDRSDSVLDAETLDQRLGRRMKNWIAQVELEWKKIHPH